MRRKGEDTRGKFISFPDLYERWGVSNMTLERLVKEDPRFPQIYRFGPRGKFRFFDIAEVERYERASVARR
jgi:hypothetical protein